MSQVSYNLDDKVFVVTGGSRGIGLEISRLLLAQQAKVVICGRKQAGLEAAAASLGAGEDRLLAVSAHIAREEEVDQLFNRALEKFERIDGLKTLSNRLQTDSGDMPVNEVGEVIDNCLAELQAFDQLFDQRREAIAGLQVR